jgi:hypothetical protein
MKNRNLVNTARTANTEDRLPLEDAGDSIPALGEPRDPKSFIVITKFVDTGYKPLST